MNYAPFVPLGQQADQMDGLLQGNNIPAWMMTIGSAPESSIDSKSAVAQLAMAFNADLFKQELARAHPDVMLRWKDVADLLKEVDRHTEIDFYYHNELREMMVRYRFPEQTIMQDAKVTKNLEELFECSSDRMSKMWDAISKESRRLATEKLACERRLVEFEKGMDSIRISLDAIKDQLTQITDSSGSDVDHTAIQTYIQASSAMLDEMRNKALERITHEAKQLFDINHRLMLIQRWTHVNHIRGGEGSTDCAICYTTPINAFFMPCGHTGCFDCMTRLTKCHMCNAHVMGGPKKIYFSGIESTTGQTATLAERPWVVDGRPAAPNPIVARRMPMELHYEEFIDRHEPVVPARPVAPVAGMVGQVPAQTGWLFPLVTSIAQHYHNAVAWVWLGSGEP